MTSSFQIVDHFMLAYMMFCFEYFLRLSGFILYLNCFSMWILFGTMMDMLERTGIFMDADLFINGNFSNNTINGTFTSCYASVHDNIHSSFLPKNEQWSTLLHEWL